MNNEKPPKNIISILHNWSITSSFIVAIWAVCTFVYIEVYKPYSQISFFSVDIELTQHDDIKISNNETVIPITITLTGKNNSKRRLSIVSGYVQVWGDHLEGIQEIKKDNLLTAIQKVFDEPNSTTGRYYPSINSTTLFISSIFKNWSFEPGEFNKESKIFYLPKNKFNMVEAKSFVVSGPKGHKIDFNHNINKDLTISYSIKDPNKKSKVLEFGEPEFMETMYNLKLGKVSTNYYLILK